MHQPTHQANAATADDLPKPPVMAPQTRVMSSGLLLVDKPAGVTSHDVVARCRRAVASKRVGHAGTLDPFATGLLVIGVGNATRLLPYLDGEPKVYEAVIRFGFETNTDDATGVETIRGELPAWNNLLPAIGSLTGCIAQTPPAFSAKHINGERAYAMARRGENVELSPVNITVFKWELLNRTHDTLSVVITCGGGTYIRALARDLGRLLGSAAHCDSLRRIRSGACNVIDAVPFDALMRGALADGLIALSSPVPALQEMAMVAINAVEESDIRNGRSIVAAQEGERAALLSERGEIVAIANRNEFGRWQPRVVLPNGGAQ